ncbi:MAG: hypothetical protein U9Q81_21400 [Pseudomonadota bacterium]|nr:hypothetical protein [Pseudomonadota bacterium]
MTNRKGLAALLIITVVVAIAVWSRLRHTDQEGYDEPQRWRINEHPVLQRQEAEVR